MWRKTVDADRRSPVPQEPLITRTNGGQKQAIVNGWEFVKWW